MIGMPAYNVSRAVDLSGIAAAAKAPPPPSGASYVTEADEKNFESIIQQSVKYPILVEFYSPRAKAQELSDALIELANAAGGKYLLARVNVDTAGQLAQAFGVQAVPLVVGIVGGQLAPLFQGTKAKAEVEVVIGQLLQAAAQAGITGIAEPVSIDMDAAPDPRFAEADAALERGDYAVAVAEFDKLLAANPADVEAKVGRAQAALLDRITNNDAKEVLLRATADPHDPEAGMSAADIELAGGKKAEAFSRLIALIRENTGDLKDALRQRLLELFDTVGNDDPDVAKARRELMTALF
jgi:putative thioredoxin